MFSVENRKYRAFLNDWKKVEAYNSVNIAFFLKLGGVFLLKHIHFDIYLSNRATLDLSVHLTTVFKMSKYMKHEKIN